MNDTPHAMTENKRIDGTAVAAQLRQRLAQQIETLNTAHSVTPGLAVVMVGGDPASRTYVRKKRRHAAEVGMHAWDYDLPADTSTTALLNLIDELNRDARVHGILVQLPLPAQIALGPVLSAIDPEKDVDGFHEINTGRLWQGEPCMSPCTPTACCTLLEHVHGEALAGLHAVVVGRSNIVGKPLASLLLRANCTVTVAHSRTQGLAALCRQADIVVAAVGIPELVRAHWIKPGATVIDVGITRCGDGLSGKLRLIGDVAYAEVSRVAGAITPVPGGVGPMTIACLLDNTVTAACRQHAVQRPDDQAARSSRPEPAQQYAAPTTANEYTNNRPPPDRATDHAGATHQNPRDTWQ